jgi:plastocyanin
MTTLIKRISLVILPVTLGIFAASATLQAEGQKATKTAKTIKSAPEKAAAVIKAATVIKFDAKEVKGAKVWLPAESTAKVGEPVTLEVHNSLEAPHGFKIEGYVPETAVGAGETKTFTFTPKEKGVLKVTCHLHPAHVGAEIKVQ